MWKPVEFANALRKQWGTFVTSGAFVGALGIWQNLGHHLPPAVYWTVALVGLAVAFYRVWLAENVKHEAGMAGLEYEKSLHGGPEISFSWAAVPPLNTRKTLFLENTGTIDAYEVKISDVGLNKVHCGARFPIIPKCVRGSVNELSFELYGDVLLAEPERSNLEMVIFASQSDFQKGDRGEPVVEFPIAVTFEEYGGARYEAKFCFVADTDLSKVNIHRISRQRIPKTDS